MTILHGNWILENQERYFFIWGETWRFLNPISIETASDDVPLNPLGTESQELVDFLRTRKFKLTSLIPKVEKHSSSNGKKRKSTDDLSLKLKNTTQIIALPTTIEKAKISVEQIFISPVHSLRVGESENINSCQYIQPWRVDGIILNSTEAIKFLSNVPLDLNSTNNEFIGGDLRFWSQIARWSLDLISRCKFLPILERELDTSGVAKWQVLLDSAIDSSRLENFARLMPAICRVYQQDSKNLNGNEELSTSKVASAGSSFYLDLPQQPQELILDFLNSVVDSQVRKMVGTIGTGEARLISSLPFVVRQWLQGLIGESNVLKADTIAVERLDAVLKSWTLPLQYQLAGKKQFRTCFELRSPESGKTDWTLVYFLQATDNSEFLVDADTIWKNPVERLAYQERTIEQPQETFLQGLGLASRLYPAIAESLDSEYPSSCTLSPMQAYEFIKSVVWRFEDSGLGVILPPSLANREGWANRLGLKVKAQTSRKKQAGVGLQSLLNFKWELAIGGQTLSKTEFDSLVALNSPLVEINGEWVELRPQDIKTAQSFFTSRKEQMSLSLEDALRLSTGDTQTIEKLPVVSFDASGALKELVGTLADNQSLKPLPTPKKFQGTLRPYQEKGFSWLTFLERWGLGACLADDMGLGKTIQLIAFVLHLKEEKSLENPILLVCPTSVIGNWEREVNKFAPVLKVLQYHGDKRPKGKKFQEVVNKSDLVITSYSLVHRDLKILKGVNWQGIVLDEAQNIKNSEAKQSQAIRDLEATFRIALTGTPVENRLQELWSILDFLNPGYLGNRQFFQRRFAIPIEKYGDADSLSQLRSLVQPFILRRLKTDRDIIQDLPEKQEINVFCSLSPEQAQLYQETVENSLSEIESAEGVQRRGMILGLLVKLKQICNHPAQYLKTKTLAKQSSGKLQRLEEMLEEVTSAGDRALIFTQFAEWGKLLKPHLEKNLGREILFLYGSTTKKKREEMIDRFQHDPQGPPIMILSLKAGGVGLNLTRANHVFHFDRWWNPAVENQATDRVFRIGQTRNVQVHKFVCTGTLEEKIHDMIESKKQLAEQVVGTGEEWLTELDTDQLRDLLLLDRNAVIEEE
ncbi:DEAD/DEAH box helicase [Mastigocoleus testarum]|uniref:Helicase n=1 Tax=Mastigocoleus testarum BC008 TaxID=371196 RepID=A0A0V7ZIB2_9CYAN|nr:DEAD/DEAH box helicase [Mastigocoleus testarum]KST64293.1 helicase [Mastigocoleus testarum BC008]